MSSVSAAEKQILGHPRGLFVLFFTEMWERFSFYGMKALLIFYLTKYHFFTDSAASGIIGSYAALVYALPVLGGYLADKYLGFKKAVTFGALLLIIGHLGMAFEGHQAYIENGVTIRDGFALKMFYMSISFIIMGVGFLKPNISSIVGDLYPSNDARRDSGFTIFYIGINVGSTLSILLCGWLGETFGWRYGFGAAGVGMIAGLLTFLSGQKYLVGIGDAPHPDKLRSKVLGLLSREYLIYLSALGALLVVWFLMQYHDVVGVLLLASIGATLLFLSWYMAARADKVIRGRLFVLIVLNISAVVYFGYMEQQFISLNLFTDRIVNREVFGHIIKASAFVSLNPIFIILCGPFVAWMWIGLNKRNLEPNSTAKFGWGIVQASLGYGLLALGIYLVGGSGKVSLIWLVLSYLIVTTGELFLSPVGLSTVTKLSPRHMVGFMMGVWFLFTAAGEYMAALLSKLADIDTVGGEMADITQAYDAYSSLYSHMMYYGLGFGALLLLLSPFLRKLMYGVK